MKPITVFISIAVTLFACKQKAKTISWQDLKQHDYLLIDSDTLTNIKWIKLNDYVDYFVLQQKGTSTDTGITLQLLGEFVKNKYGTEYANDTVFPASRNDLFYLAMDSTLFKGKRWDYLLKIKNEIEYQRKPWLLDSITIFADHDSQDSLADLISTLRQLSFVNHVRLDSFPLSMLDSLDHDYRRNKYIAVGHKGGNSLDSVIKYCHILKRITNVSNASYNELFIGRDLPQAIFRVTKH